MENRNRIVIAGAGITGLTIAFRLKQKGIPFLLLEALPAPGGKIGTLEKNGFHLDLGPATCARNQPLTELRSALAQMDDEKLIKHQVEIGRNLPLVIKLAVDVFRFQKG